MPIAITFCPRSCPSCPILATRIRGRRPFAFLKMLRQAYTLSQCRRLAGSPAVYAGNRLCFGAMAAKYFFQRADISPTVAFARAAFTQSSSRFPCPLRATCQRIQRRLNFLDCARSRTSASLSICLSRTAALSTSSTSIVFVRRHRYLFTPTIDLLRRSRFALGALPPPLRSSSSAIRSQSPAPCRRAPRLLRSASSAFRASSYVSHST